METTVAQFKALSHSTPVRPDQLRGPPSLPFNSVWGPFPVGSAAEVWRWPLTSIQCRRYEWMALYLYSAPRQASVVCTCRTFTCTLSRHLRGSTDQKRLTPTSGRTHSRPKFELGTSRIRRTCDNQRLGRSAYSRIPLLREYEGNEVWEQKRSQYHVRQRTSVMHSRRRIFELYSRIVSLLIPNW